jgi:hypothetical protein
MGNVLYPTFKEGLLNKQHNLLSDTVKVALVDVASSVYNAGHQFVSDIAPGIVARSPALTGKTTTGGLFMAAYTTIPVVTGPSVEALALFVDKGGADSANPLMGWIDDPAITYDPNGSDAEIRWSTAGIFTL